MNDPSASRPTDPFDVLAGGAMGTLVRSLDWSHTPLGPPVRWPQSLKTAVAMCLESAFPMSVLWGPELVQIYNDAYRPILGAKHPRSLGRPARECWADLWPRVGPAMERALATGRATWAADLSVQAACVTLSFSPIRDERGSVAGLLATCAGSEGPFADGRPEASVLERSLQEEVERGRQLRLITDTLPALVAYIDADEIYRFVNASYGEWFGIDPASLVGKAVRDTIRARDFGRAKEFVARALAGERVDFETAVGTGERARDVLVTYVPDRGDDGVVRGFVALLTDVTSRKADERRLREAQRMEAVGTLAGGMAHEVNNMMAAVIGFGEYALRTLPEGSSERADVEEIVKAGHRASAITQQLLAFSRRQVLQPAVLDPNAVVTDVTKMLHRLVGDHVELELRLDPEVGSIVAERGQIDQVLVNLVLNARDAMPQGGRVTIRTGEVAVMEERHPLHTDPGLPLGWHIVIEVTDTGTGMDAATQRRAFEPFFTTKPVGEGTGLGLSTVYGIIAQSGGTVALDSSLGVGTTVRLYLPRASAAPSAPAAAAAVRQGEGETVLVVEDEDIVRRLARRVLEDAGYRVLEARSGREALDIIDGGETIDLVLTDLVMPELGGVELGRLLATRPGAPRVLYMSAYTRDHIVQHGLLADGVVCVQKPFDVHTLALEVRRALGGG